MHNYVPQCEALQMLETIKEKAPLLEPAFKSHNTFPVEKPFRFNPLKEPTNMCS